MSDNENQGATVERIIARDTPTDDEREPSEHRDRIALAEFIDKALDGDAGYGVGEFLAGGILSFLGERAALRAASAVTEQGDNRNV